MFDNRIVRRHGFLSWNLRGGRTCPLSAIVGLGSASRRLVVGRSLLGDRLLRVSVVCGSKTSGESIFHGKSLFSESIRRCTAARWSLNSFSQGFSAPSAAPAESVLSVISANPDSAVHNWPLKSHARTRPKAPQLTQSAWSAN